MSSEPDLIARREAVGRIVRTAIDRALRAELDPHAGRSLDYRMKERAAARNEATDAILTTLEASDADTVRDLIEAVRGDIDWLDALSQMTVERDTMVVRIRAHRDLLSRAAMLTAAHPKPEPVETQPAASRSPVEEERAREVLAKIMNRHASHVLFHDTALADEAWEALSNTQPQAPSEEAARSMDESGSPDSVGCIAQSWITERGKEAAGVYGAERVEMVYEPAKALILYVDRNPMNVATIWRDPMNFSQLVRWSATIGNPAATDTQPVAGGGE